MRVTVICDVLGEANNGTTLAALNLIRYLREKGHTVTVVAPGKQTDIAHIEVPILNLGSFCNTILRKNGVCLAKVDKNILDQAIRGADVVHLLLPFPLSWAALKIAQKYGIPCTASFHCQAENITAHIGLMNNRLVSHWIYKAFYHKVYRYCAAVHYPTDFIRQVFESQTHPTHAYVISNGVNDMFVPAQVRAPHEKFTILCSGRYSREKAQGQLIRAVAKLPYKDRIHVIFAGDGPRKAHLQKLAKKYAVDCEFQFFSRPDLLHKLQNADLYVHTALIEIEAIACIEAICCGLVPVICNSGRSATRFFAIGEKTLFEPFHIRDLAEKIDYWYNHPAEKEAKSREFESLRGRFAQKSCMERMEAMLLEAAGKR